MRADIAKHLLALSGSSITDRAYDRIVVMGKGRFIPERPFIPEARF